MVDLNKILLSGLILLLLGYIFIINANYKDQLKVANEEKRNIYTVIDATDKENYKILSSFSDIKDKNAEFAKIYSIDNNFGYLKKVETKGNIKFTVFTRSSQKDNFHPDFLCFVELDNFDDLTNVYFKGSFVSKSNTEEDFSAGSLGQLNKEILVIGNLDDNSDFKLSIGIPTEEEIESFRKNEQEAMDKNLNKLPNILDYIKNKGEAIIKIQN